MITKINTYFRGEITPKYQACIDSIIQYSKVDVNIIKTLPKECLSLPGNPKDESVGVRLHALCADPWSLWLDTDIMLNRWFECIFNIDNKPYVYSAEHPCCAIYGNGNRAIFEDIYGKWLERKGEFCCCFYIKDQIEKFNVFPNGYMQHLAFRGRG